MHLPHLPINSVLHELKNALRSGSAVLAAPPGSGKTTLVPLALLEEPWLRGKKIIILEPRRLATRAAAARMAKLMGEPVSRTIGYQIPPKASPIRWLQAYGLLLREQSGDVLAFLPGAGEIRDVARQLEHDPATLPGRRVTFTCRSYPGDVWNPENTGYLRRRNPSCAASSFSRPAAAAGDNGSGGILAANLSGNKERTQGKISKTLLAGRSPGSRRHQTNKETDGKI